MVGLTTALVVLLPALQAHALAPLGRRGTPIANEYIVRLHDEANLLSEESAIKILKEDPRFVYKSTIKGFSATMDAQTLDAMRQHPDVMYIEENGMSKAALYSAGVPTKRTTPLMTGHQSDWLNHEKAVWGLARVSSIKHKGWLGTYTYHKSAGAGVCAYVIDTGVDDKQADFKGGIKQLKNWMDKEENKDLHGHGTHVAGTLASFTYGVAKAAYVIGLKVLGKNAIGPDDGVVAAIDFVAEDVPKRNCSGVVVNLSLVADNYHQIMNDACANLVKKGYMVAAASGNDNRDASKDSPGSEPLVCNAGAFGNGDKRSGFSNFGKLIDINAPGEAVKSHYPDGKDNSLSGTSMASPHLAGLGAVLISEKGIKGSDACDELKKLAHKNAIEGLVAETPNLLAFNGNPGAK